MDAFQGVYTKADGLKGHPTGRIIQAAWAIYAAAVGRLLRELADTGGGVKPKNQ